MADVALTTCLRLETPHPPALSMGPCTMASNTEPECLICQTEPMTQADICLTTLTLATVF